MEAIKNRWLIILILGLLSAIGPFSIDMYLPGFPAIAADLGTTTDRVSYSLSSFFIGICAGQLLCGPLLDRFGRKRPLLAGLLLYIIASIGCALAGSIEVLVAMRFLQALGGCVGIVAPRAIVRDVFPVQENAKIFSLLILILGVSPIVAPTAGSYVVTVFGWNWVFVVLAIITLLIAFAVIFLLPESKAPDPNFSLRPAPILKSFKTVLKQPQFFTYAIAGAISAAGLYAYLAGSPVVFMELFKVSEAQYGKIFAFIALGLITSSQVNNFLLKKFSSQQIIQVSLLVQSVAGALFFFATAFHVQNLSFTVAVIFFFLACQGFSFPNSSALSMEPFTREAGSASALMGAIQMALGAVASALVGTFNNGTALPMAAIMASCAFCGWLIVIVKGKRLQRRTLQVQEQRFEMLTKE